MARAMDGRRLLEARRALERIVEGRDDGIPHAPLLRRIGAKPADHADDAEEFAALQRAARGRGRP